MTNTMPRNWLHTGALAALLLATAWPAAAAHSEPGQGFYRTVEGGVRLTTYERAEPLDVEPNYPLLPGDRVWVGSGSRLEAMLPDRTLIRADGGTDLFFEELALSSDGDAGASNLLRLLEGEAQIVLPADAPEDTRVDTASASIYLQAPGSYLLSADDRGSTLVTVREGFAEVVTARGSAVVRAGEEGWVRGVDDLRVDVRRAGALADVELWGEELYRYASRAVGDSYVDESLSYAAAPLYRHGSWVSVDGRRAWRPTVYAGWRPYSSGYWAYTPSGLSWVAPEPWGWVTAHYGVWDFSPIYGWIWLPGYVYSPAWVYWYWGPSHVGWVPAGYYTRFYGPRFGASFHFGVYGWAGGSWGYYDYWTFCPVRYFGFRSYRTYWRSGYEVAQIERGRAVPRGLITNDTRDLHPRLWNRPTEVVRALHERAQLHERGAVRRELADVTDFVARRSDLRADAREAVLTRRLSAEAGSVRRGAAPREISRGERPWAIERARPESGRTSSLSERRSPSALGERIEPRSGDLGRLRGRTEPPAVERDERPLPSRGDVRDRRETPAPSRGDVGDRRDAIAPSRGEVGDSRDPRTPSRGVLPERPSALSGRPTLPPSGRFADPRTRGDVGDSPASDRRVPVVRRVIDPIRESRESGPPSAPPRALPERPSGDRPDARGSRPESSRPSGDTRSAPPQRQSPPSDARSSSPRSRPDSGQARSSSRSPRSSGDSGQARSSSRSSRSSGDSGRSGSSSRSRPRKPNG